MKNNHHSFSNNDLLTPTSGEILINGEKPGVKSKEIIAYLPERTYLDKEMTIKQVIKYFEEFYKNFDAKKATKLLEDLDLDINKKISKMSKGMQEKLQLILVMSRNAELYILDEPLGGVDPATRDYILSTILSNFCEGASVIISTHLISDIERILDEVIFLDSSLINCLMRLWARFIRNVYKDESYLTHTLPVEKKTIYVSKVISALICVFTTVVVTVVCLFIYFYSEANMQILKSMLELAAETYNTTDIVNADAIKYIMYAGIGIYLVYIIFYYVLGRKQLEKGVNVE